MIWRSLDRLWLMYFLENGIIWNLSAGPCLTQPWSLVHCQASVSYVLFVVASQEVFIEKRRMLQPAPLDFLKSTILCPCKLIWLVCQTPMRVQDM